MGRPDTTQSASDPQELPLPPYPDAIGHPWTHTFRTMPDVLSFRDAAMRSHDVLSDEQLRDQVVTLTFAGHDTTASTLALALYELSRHPRLRDRFHAEVGTLSPPITRGTLSSFPVTERIVTETLRLYPPVYVLPRES